jgi:cytochrome c-type biogenesis protein CcmH
MLAVLIAATLFLQQPIAPVTPEDSLLEARVSALASTLRCPICQGLSIEDSPAPLAKEMRAVVRDQLKAGRTPAEIKAYFVAKYSEFVLLQPEPRGFNLTVYILPVVLLLGGVVLVVRVARKWSRGASGVLAASEVEQEPEFR